MSEADIEELASRYVWAMWSLEKQGDEEIRAFIDANDIHTLYSWARDIAAGEDGSDMATRVWNESVAMRLEGDEPGKE